MPHDSKPKSIFILVREVEEHLPCYGQAQTQIHEASAASSLQILLLPEHYGCPEAAVDSNQAERNCSSRLGCNEVMSYVNHFVN